MRRPFSLAAFIVASATLASCDSSGSIKLGARSAADSVRADSVARARQDSVNRTLPGYVIDSILPVEEELRRFRAGIGGDPVTRLSGGSSSREALVQRFVASLAKSDTNDLRAMVVRAREFADIYYPESPYTHPPYRESPRTAWQMIQNPSEAGLSKLLRRYGGTDVKFLGLRCEPKTVREGRNTRHTGCIVDLSEAGSKSITRRLFGSILEHDGQFKFLSYTNQF